MKNIVANIGYREECGNGEIRYRGGQSDNGWCYKDMDAFKNGVGVCYIGEYSLGDIERNEDAILWTYEMLINEVRETLEREYPKEMYSNEKFIEFLTESVLETCDWQEPSTYLLELTYDDSIYEMFADKKLWDN